jgi:hypothetical protein
MPPSTSSQNGADNIQVMRMGDNQTPRVADWNITVSQAMPWRSVFEISYVANKSTGQLINGTNDKIGDINAVLPGSYYRPNPAFTDAAHPNGGINISTGPLTCGNPNDNPTGQDPTFAADCLNSNFGTPNYKIYQHAFGDGDRNGYRPLTQYANVYEISHGGYANYNSLQASWQKQSGPVTFLTNYTYSKVLGTRDGQTDNGAGNGRGLDPFNIKANYGPLAYDHTHIVNLSYVWNLPKFVHGSKVLGGAINGWQLSGWTTYQSGAPIQPNTGGNLNAGFAGGLTTPLQGVPDLPDNTILLPNGLRSNQVNAATWYGTDQNGGGYVAMMPKLTCDPSKGLKSGQYFNPSCFTVPAFGQLGTIQMPYMRTPAYFNSDLAVFKNFQINERQKLQFRLSATNWLNHPLPQFALAGNGDIALNFQQNSTMTESNTAECGIMKKAVDPVTNTCQLDIVSSSPVNTNAGTTGKPSSKTGSRTLTFSLKYYF